jgi:hypothetical protein
MCPSQADLRLCGVATQGSVCHVRCGGAEEVAGCCSAIGCLACLSHCRELPCLPITLAGAEEDVDEKQWRYCYLMKQVFLF